MKPNRAWFLGILSALLLNAVGGSQVVGTLLRPQGFTEFTGNAAADLADYGGRLVLLEFFAHW